MNIPHLVRTIQLPSTHHNNIQLNHNNIILGDEETTQIGFDSSGITIRFNYPRETPSPILGTGNSMATTANNLENEVRNVARVEFFVGPNGADMTIHVDGDAFDCIKQDKTTKEFVVTPARELHFRKTALVAQLIEKSPEFGEYMGTVGKISPQILAAYLRKAKIVFDHKFVAKDDTVTQYDGTESTPFKHDGYSDTIKSVVFTQKVLDKFDEVFDKVIDMELNGIFTK